MLDGDHARLVQAVLPVCAKYGLAVAGGYAINAHGLVERPSEDIDFATATTASMGEIMTALADAYTEAGYEVEVLDVDLRKGHLLVKFPLSLDPPVKCRVRRLLTLASTRRFRVCLPCC
jgi:hypothetical protein